MSSEHKLLGTAAGAVLRALDQVPDDHAHAPFLGFMSALTMEIQEDRWRAMVRASSEPCGKEGCDCHERGRDVMQSLDRMRSAFIAKSKAADGSN